jgi:predicted glycosyltransferase
MNIYLLSQHSLGVGHLSRTSLLAGEIARIPGVSVIHISCGPSTGIVPSQPDVLLVELPPLIVKGLSSIELVPVEQGKTKEEVEKERVGVIETLFRRHPPDMFITEFFPFSPHRLDGTVLPVLRTIKERHPTCTIVCSSRDIPVCHGEALPPEKVASIASIFNAYYDLLLVHSDPALLKLTDIPKYRGLRLSCPVVYTGYICERRSTASPRDKADGRILVTVGGGRDGQRTIDCALKVAGLGKGYRFDIVCGPFMEKGTVDAMSRGVAHLENVQVHWYVRNLKETIVGYDLVICSGGYNTLMETIVRRKRCISVPRRGSYEQGKRVKVFSRKQLLRSIAESRLTVRRLSRLIDEAFAEDYEPAFRINTDGLKNTVASIENWQSCGAKSGSGDPGRSGSIWPASGRSLTPSRRI